MTKITIPAIRIGQGKRHLFLTYLTVRDLRQDNFYRVDKLDVKKSTGMQRLLNETRAKSFANDIVGANKENEAFLPTSIFLATEKTLSYSDETKKLSFDTDIICPLEVVDGQHRIEGLKIAADKELGLLDFPISTVIAHELNELEMMLQFVTVNTKQDPVHDSVKQGIIARFTEKFDLERLPYLPSWLGKKVRLGHDRHALKIAMELNEDEKSPWYSLIHLAGEDKDRVRNTINQATFVKSVKRHLLSRNHPYGSLPVDNDKKIGILRNYWRAIRSIFVDVETDETPTPLLNTVVFKYTGLEFFHFISARVFYQLAKNGKYTVEAIESCINSVRDYLENTPDMMFPEYWKVGGKAGGLNAAAIRRLAGEFNDALLEAHKVEAHKADDIEI